MRTSHPKDPIYGVRHSLPLALRTDLMLLPESGVLERFSDFLVVRTPDNPNFWWGNSLFFDRPPARGDLQRWEEAFETHVRAQQPNSRHTTFSWAGSMRGEVAPFLQRGYSALDSIVMSAEYALPYRGCELAIKIKTLGAADWEAMHDLMLAHRGPGHPLESYEVFSRQRIAQWRRRVEARQGAWYGAYLGANLVASLGVFVEAQPDDTGVRLARFQEVLTAERYRRRGLAGTLVSAACADMIRNFGPLRFVIVADQNHAAQRIYRALGFDVVERYKGLEKGGY